MQMPIVELTEDHQDRAFALLVAAFAADPFTRWFFGDPDDLQALFPVTLRHVGGSSFAHGGALATDDIRGVALWLPPGVAADFEGMGAAFAEAGFEGPEEAQELFARMTQTHPHESHWYLPLIGVDPMARGRGFGSALMEAALVRVDAEGLPAYLENTNPRNAPLYERFGFRMVSELQVGGSPVVQAMWRHAARG